MYDAQGREIPSPQSVCEGQCHDCQRADEGTTAEIKDGDVWLGGKLISSPDNAGGGVHSDRILSPFISV